MFQSADDKQAVFKGVTVVDAPIHIVMELLMDSAKKTSFDSFFEECVFVEDITSDIKGYDTNNWGQAEPASDLESSYSLFSSSFVVYFSVEIQKFWAPWPVSKRDFCLAVHKARLENGTIILCGKSVVHEKAPEVAKYIRGHVAGGGWLVEPVDDDHTRITYASSSDMKGSIPSMIKSAIDRKQPALVNQLKPILKKRMKELSKMSEEERVKLTAELIGRIHTLPIYTAKELEQLKQPGVN